jgi:hypothetical protein
MITIQPTGGLCNRMRATDSAISLSKKLNKPLRLVWCKNQELNCGFDELFVVPKSVEKFQQHDQYYDPSNRVARFQNKLSKEMAKKLAFFYYEKSFTNQDITKLINQEYNFEDLASYKRIFLLASRRFYSSTHPFQEFRPVESIQKVIDSYTKNFNHTIGVHIRRSDNVKAIEHSPIEKFISLMEKEVSNNQNVTFFLATDSTNEESLLKARFPGRIIAHSKESLSRTNPQAIHDALVDLFCLSKCNKLIGSFHSSFTDTAWQINNIERVIAKQGDSGNTGSVWSL